MDHKLASFNRQLLSTLFSFFSFFSHSQNENQKDLALALDNNTAFASTSKANILFKDFLQWLIAFCI